MTDSPTNRAQETPEAQVPLWVRSVGVPTWVTNPSGEIIFANDRAETLLGQSLDHLTRQPCHLAVCGTTPDGRQLCGPNCSFRETARIGIELEPVPMSLRSHDGREQFVRLIIIAVRMPPADGTHLVHCALDETKERRFQRYFEKVLERNPDAPIPLTEAGVTSRELEVLQLLAEDQTLHAIAESLGVSYSTVRNHVQHLLQKLHVHSILEAVAVYLLTEESPPA